MPTTQLNLFYSHTIVRAIQALAKAAKETSGGKLLTVFFYGYLLALADDRMAGSGHLALGALLDSPAVDAVASPYRYPDIVRNSSLGPLMPHGPWDSAALHGKAWVLEDDSRTSLDPKASHLKYCTTVEESANLLRRNVLTTIMHGSAGYFYDLGADGWFGRPDLGADGWFGRPDEPGATDVLWDTIEACFATLYGDGGVGGSGSSGGAAMGVDAHAGQGT